ncbi:hypothetical protein O9993_15530 [Vibrio lentus]|nr:hypothetical protein [Vibrio lentus]
MGLGIAPRGGIEINDLPSNIRQLLPHAIIVCAGTKCSYGLVAPGYKMATVAVNFHVVITKVHLKVRDIAKLKLGESAPYRTQMARTSGL